MRACDRLAVATPPPTLLPTFAPTLLGGTAREPSCICAPFESVCVRVTHASTPRRVFECAVRACVRACVPSRGTAGTGGIDRSARRCALCVSVFGRAAGASWRSRTKSAPWAARFGHSTVIDAVSGAIYVIGGRNDTTYFNDVFVSTDGGALPDSRRGWSGGLGVHRVLAGYLGVPRGFVGYSEYSRSSLGVPRGHPRGTRALPWGTRCTHG